MADKNVIDKVKELLDSNANASLKEAAKKWLDEVDAKYGDKIDKIMDKGEDVLDKVGDLAEKYAEKSIEVTGKFDEISEKLADGVDKISDKAAPVVEGLKDKAAPKIEELKGKAAPTVSKVTENEFIKQLKEGISSLDEVIDIFGKKDMKEKMGEEAAEQIKAHAEAMKAEGKVFCDCPACTKAREILKDLGVELETPDVEPPEAE